MGRRASSETLDNRRVCSQVEGSAAVRGVMGKNYMAQEEKRLAPRSWES